MTNEDFANKIKDIRARQDMEKFLGKKVFLETYVKTLKNFVMKRMLV